MDGRYGAGDRGPAVVEITDRLVRIGLLGSTSEEFAEEADLAVRAFQQSRGITVDGVVGPVTFRRLEEARWSLGDRVLTYVPGHMIHGEDVSHLQQRLTEMGFGAGRVDGIFGPLTDHALREFQRNYGLSVDGTAGPAVFKALSRLSNTVRGGMAASLLEELAHARRCTGIADKVIVLDGGSATADGSIPWDISARVEGRLAAIGTQVLIAPGGVSEAERAQFANSNDADLIISIHTNSHSGCRARGVAAYYYGNGEHFSSLGQKLAEQVQEAIVEATDLVDCRTHEKTWDLLRLTRMPAVRIECGYLSHPDDATRLLNPVFRDAVAESIADSVVEFFSPESLLATS